LLGGWVGPREINNNNKSRSVGNLLPVLEHRYYWSFLLLLVSIDQFHYL